ncbi:unnamed protein product [Polarella glacialis]|uniref:Uncharacterized protein n=1 Tax=Polarella glacialis TaxID=89957 RepID=A0A813JE24_POLGL|nr:unnamed protein product [Polarella glacialis]
MSSSLLQARKQQAKQEVASGQQQVAGLLEQLTEMKEMEEEHAKKMETMEAEQAKKMTDKMETMEAEQEEQTEEQANKVKKLEEEQAKKMKTMEEEQANIKKMEEELRTMAPVQASAVQGFASLAAPTPSQAALLLKAQQLSNRSDDLDLAQTCRGRRKSSFSVLAGHGREIDVSGCSDRPVRGQSSKAACCQCGGGHVTPTPFSYPDKRWAVGSDVLLRPVPRTAVRYSLNADCQLAAFNMTMDGATGVITSLPGLDKPTEPFSLQCEVSARQAEGVAFTVVVTVAADHMTYQANALLFHTKDASYEPLTGSGEWANFSLACAPDAKWLEISEAGGQVRLSQSNSNSKSQGGGAITDLQEGQSSYTDVDGALCFVTGWQKGGSSSTASKRKARLVALKPQLWTTLKYEAAAVEVVLGEELQPLKLQTPAKGAGQGSLKPTAFTLACDVSGHAGVDSLPFVFDGLLKTGFIGGHQVLQVSADGQITIAPEESLAAVFDGITAAGEARKALELSCGVWGSFPGTSGVAPLRAELAVTIRDDFCWISQSFKGEGEVDVAAASESECRMRCRMSKSCSHWAWNLHLEPQTETGSRRRFSFTRRRRTSYIKSWACTRYRVQTKGNSFTAWAKITDCTDLSTCLQLTHPTWLLSGTYCPLGRDLRHKRVVYRKSGGAPEDTVYLSVSEGSEGPTGCGKGHWILQKPAPNGRDFLDANMGYFELTGEVLLCLPPSVPSSAGTATLDWVGRSCSVPAFPEREEGQLQSFVFDDPGTQQPDDHWLHPCDCAPPSWGSQYPVNPGLFENIPPGSNNSFIPTSFVIVAGQFACPSRQLLPGEAGVHFESETESMEASDCESRCKDEAGCNFFWHGTSHGALTCRLFSACDSLVREFGLNGDLAALPRTATCQVSNPEACWATTVRRLWLTNPLTSERTDAAAQSADSIVDNPYATAKPADPAGDGMVAWFQSESAGSEWISSVNDYVGRVTAGAVTRLSASGFGADGPVTHIEGSSSDKYTFGKVLKDTFSVCSVTRYTGANQKRILQGSTGNFLHGQHGGHSGVAHYDAWVTASARKEGSRDWVVLCGTNKAKRVYDGDSSKTNIGTKVGNSAGPTELMINSGASSTEISDFAVMELITWSRALSAAEFATAIAYLNWKLEAGTYQAMQHLSTLSQSSFFTKAQELKETDTYTKTLDNDYKVELRGWSQTSSYANGYVRDVGGSASATVTGLTPGSNYAFNIYQVASEFGGSNTLSINHGAGFPTTQGLSTSPSASGKATATPRGEVVFEFTGADLGITWTDVLSGKSGSKDDSPTSASCPSGTVLTGCVCYSPWSACDGAKSSGNTCTAYNNGGSGVYAQARCASLPGASKWSEVLSGKSGSKDDNPTSASCPSGTVLTGCTCYSPWKGCDGAKSSGNTCTAYNNGGSGVYAQARCGSIPGASKWSEVLSGKSGGKDDNPTSAACPTGTYLTGCTCYSPWNACDGAKASGNTCTAYNNGGSGVYAQARCGAIPSVSVHLSGIALSGRTSRKSGRPADPAGDGMVAWFQSESAGSEWISSVNDYVGRVTAGAVTRLSASGFGADGPVTHIEGSSSDKYTFGKVLKDTFSVCSVTRYTGANQKRILQGSTGNFLHGQHGGHSGVAHYDAWVTASARKEGSRDWVVLCGTNKAKRVYDGDSSKTNIGTKVGNSAGPTELMINSGASSTEISDFAVMELITWSRALSAAEFATAIAYLNWKLQAGTYQAMQHLSTLSQSSFFTKAQELKETDTYAKTLDNDYKVELRGWSQTSSYANGYVRDVGGSASATVTGLTPGSNYAFNIYQVASEFGGSNTLSINHGAGFPTTQGLSTSPSASGKATATPRGEVVFEFTGADLGITWTEVLSGKSGSKDDSPTSASCPSGTVLTGCVCYSPWSACDGAKSSGNTCTAYNNGGSGVYAQARCASLPGASKWSEVLSGKSGSKDDNPTSASCPSGTVLTGCTCYSPWKGCDGAKSSGNTCTAYNNGGSGVYAQARCGSIPGASKWSEVLSGKSGGKDDNPTSAACPTGTYLTGCTCYSPWNACDGAKASGNTCTAYNNGGSGVYAQARCGAIPSVSVHLSGIAIAKACDSQLLLGGLGVEHCSRPTYRSTNSHEWREKRPLPAVFAHGSELAVSCWTERFVGFQGFQRSASELLHCVNGEWYNSQEKPQLQGFTCESCLFMGGKGYATLAKRNEQELYYFNKLSLSVYSELGTLLSAASGGKYCLQPSSNANSPAMLLSKQASCNGSLLIQTVATSTTKNRLMRLAHSTGQCLQGTAAEDGSVSAVHQACDESKSVQLIAPNELPSILWDLHVDADKVREGDLHTAYSSYCGSHGALNTIAFGQIFGGVTTGAKSSCHFAPVVTFGKFVDTSIARNRLSTSWADWHHLLADNPIMCPLGEALTGLKLDSVSNSFLAECSRIGGLGASFDYFSDQVEVTAFQPAQSNWLKTMKMLRITCGDNGLVSGFHFEFSEGGKWARAKYTCSKAGGAPVVVEPAGLVAALLPDEEGIYCPSLRDAGSGRLSYASEAGVTLEFQADGRWCMGSICSEDTGALTPAGLTLSTFDVVNVSDFTGEFAAAGVPQEGGLGDPKDLAKRLKALKPPKRPAQPPQPELGDFKAEQPKYSEECLDYKDLWKNMKETYTNNEDEEVTEESTLQAEEGTKGAELLDYHPCAVAQSAGGIFGKIGKGNGQLAPENMMYKDWNDCMQGDIERDLASAHVDLAESITDLTSDVVQNGIKMVCAIPPDVEIAPLGVGAEVEPDSICDQVTDFVGSLVHLPIGLAYAGVRYANEQEGYAACNPLQVGFSRMFCDVHCVRDAVIRGDRTIIRNLEKATKISNDNMKKMVEWSTEAARTETEYLDKKVDYSLAVSTAYLQSIAANTQPSEAKLLQGARAASSSMLSELSGFAQLASFSELSRVTARDELERFAGSAELLEGAAPNATRLAAVLNQIASLHQVLRSASGGLSKAQAVGKQLSQDARGMQEQARRQRQVLGVYRLHSQTARSAAQGWRSRSDQRAVLVSLDHLWWQLREKLDRYLDTAEEEVKHFQAAFATMADYEHCTAGFSNLLATYTTSMAVMEESHRQLQATWRETSNLLGELAAVIVDGEAFSIFMQEEGCDSTLVQQTVKQAKLAVGGMRMLIHRFRVAGMGEPDTSSLEQASQRIQESYADSVKACKSSSA